jgi:hypothetical protein
MHELATNVQLLPVNNFNTAIVDGKFPASGSFIPASPHTWWLFLLRVGTLNSALTVQLQQDTGVTQTASIKNVTGAVRVIAADDDDELHYIEVETKAALDLDGFTHFTLDISGAAGGDDYLDIIAIGHGSKSVPITQAATVTGVRVAG